MNKRVNQIIERLLACFPLMRVEVRFERNSLDEIVTSFLLTEIIIGEDGLKEEGRSTCWITYCEKYWDEGEFVNHLIESLNRA